jgi:hypothetical protein
MWPRKAATEHGKSDPESGDGGEQTHDQRQAAEEFGKGGQELEKSGTPAAGGIQPERVFDLGQTVEHQGRPGDPRAARADQRPPAPPMNGANKRLMKFIGFPFRVECTPYAIKSIAHPKIPRMIH